MESLYKIFKNSTGISIDTRTLQKGNLFFALSGPNFNGNKYALTALEKGALAVVVDSPDLKIPKDKQYLTTNTLVTLQELAKHHRGFLKAIVIGLTGSNGKTTTKELMYNVLSSSYTTQCTKGNLNNHIGVPLTILSCKVNTEYLIVEMGANHQKEIALLCTISNPDYGLITNIGKAHLEGFGGLEGVKKGKKELYDYLVSNNKGIFIDTSDTILPSLVTKNYPLIIPYNKEDYSIEHNSPYLLLKYGENKINTQLSGSYNVGNIAAAVAIGLYFKVQLKHIIKSIEAYIPNNNRSEIQVLKGVKVFKDAYNANPTSMKLSLENFIQTYERENSIIIIGDMLELGKYSKAEHLTLLEWLDKYKFEVYAVGNEFLNYQSVFPEIKFFSTTQELKNAISLDNWVNKTVLIKGSRGIGLEYIFD